LRQARRISPGLFVVSLRPWRYGCGVDRRLAAGPSPQRPHNGHGSWFAAYGGLNPAIGGAMHRSVIGTFVGLAVLIAACREDRAIPGPVASAVSSGGGYEIIDLGTLDPAATGVSSSIALAINERGQVVGGSTTGIGDPRPQGVFHAFLWDNGVMTDLGTLGGRSSTALYVDERGDVTGGSETAGGGARFSGRTVCSRI